MSQEVKAWSHLQPKTNLRYPVSQGGGGSILPSRVTNTQYFVQRLNGNLWKRCLRHGCCLKCLAQSPWTLSNTVRPSSSKCTLCVIARPSGLMRFALYPPIFSHCTDSVCSSLWTGATFQEATCVHHSTTTCISVFVDIKTEDSTGPLILFFLHRFF